MVGQAEVAVDVPQQPGAGERIGLVDFVADLGEVGAAAHQFAGHVIGAGARGGILKRAGVGETAVKRQSAIGLVMGHSAILQQAEDEFAGEGSRAETQFRSP